MKLPQLGPGFLVTAAFIGPGTVITASLAGANFGYSLIWALLFSIFASIVLQEMAARLGIVTQQGLGENIVASLNIRSIRMIAIFLVTAAIVIGNSAYQSGNIAGAGLGLSGLFEEPLLAMISNSKLWPVMIGIVAFAVLWSGSYQILEKALMVLVGIMSIAFIATFTLSNPDIVGLFKGMFTFQLPDGASLTVIALIGTTVVPYNLFLHAAAVSNKWKSVDDIDAARKDLYLSIPIGGIISIAILSTAAAAFFGKQIEINSAADLAPSLEPLLGNYAKIFMAFGLFAAGISSAITAPLAAAYALSGVFNFRLQMNQFKFKLIWMVVLLIGVVIASLGYKPIAIIWFAQVANGILLPLICLFLIWIMNNKLLGEYQNNLWQNILGVVVLLITLLLSGKSLMAAFNLL